MANNIIKGKDLMLFNENGHSWAFATNHTLTITAETTDVSSKDHGIWSGAEISKYSWEITSENLYTVEDYDSLFSAMLAGDKVKVRFGLKNQSEGADGKNVADGTTTLHFWTAGASFYEGYVLITSLTANANNGENATMSVTLTGVGAISKTTGSNGTHADDEAHTAMD